MHSKVELLDLLRKFYTIFHKGSLILQSHEQCTSIPVYLYAHRSNLFICSPTLFFFCSSHPNGCEVRSFSNVLVFSKYQFFVFQFHLISALTSIIFFIPLFWDHFALFQVLKITDLKLFILIYIFSAIKFPYCKFSLLYLYLRNSDVLYFHFHLV